MNTFNKEDAKYVSKVEADLFKKYSHLFDHEVYELQKQYQNQMSEFEKKLSSEVEKNEKDIQNFYLNNQEKRIIYFLNFFINSNKKMNELKKFLLKNLKINGIFAILFKKSFLG